MFHMEPTGVGANASPPAAREERKPEKVFGYDVRVFFRDGHHEDFHWRARGWREADFRAILKTSHTRYEIIGTYTEEQWVRTWKKGRM